MEDTQERLIEYIHKKVTYVFPAGSRVFAAGESIYAEVDSKRIRDMSNFIVNRLYVNLRYNFKLGLPITGMGSNLIKEYDVIENYFSKHPSISFLQFDHATSHEIALCTFFKPMDFVQAGNLINELNRSLPFLINIFRRPLIHLKQAEIIQPVDAVKRVNHNTIRHLNKHPENWKDIDYVRDEIVPSKLLTRVYDDDYGIYENIVFRDLVDTTLTFLRKRIFYLTEILETFKESIQLDAVNRFNHQKYYLAIGKLYVGFYKMENSSEIQSTLENLKQLYKQIIKYKARAVYTKNANVKAVAGDIKRTNILTMHKDYKHVFALAERFKKNSAESKEAGVYETQAKSQKGYEHFCAMLMVFAATNFNLNCISEGDIFVDGKLDADFENGDWKMNLKTELNPILGFNMIVMTMEKNGVIKRFVLLPMSYYIFNEKKRIYEAIIERMFRTKNTFDKYIFLEPFDTSDSTLNNYCMKCVVNKENVSYAVLPISVTEINSFRRIQKILFEALIQTNQDFDVCAFCGEELSKEGDGYLCKKCKTGIKKITCAHCNEEFLATFVAIKQKASDRGKIEEEAMKSLSDFAKMEKQYLFRNIVNISPKGNYICPNCNGENSVK